MKNYAYLFLAAVTMFAACEKEVIPGPEPAPKNLTVFSDNFKVPDMLFKVDPVTGDTYLEVWKSEALPGQSKGNTYVPYLQRLGKDGKIIWDQWIPFTRKPGLSWINQTVFDTTTDGCVIDGFSVVGQNGKSQAFITKIKPDGSYAWGNEGKLFYDFGNKAVDSPCESFVAADNEGGAWIAAGNGAETLVIARVDSDGNFVVEPIVFSSQKGALNDEQMIRRPQMYVGQDNSLIALLQYSRDIGGGSTDIILEGHYDVVKIPADGNAGGIVQNHLYDDDELFNPGMRALLTKDGKGGAYAIFKNGISDVHAFLYHFDSNANVDVRGIDIYPSGSAFLVLALYAALDPKTNDLIVLIQDVLTDDSGYPYSIVNMQVADTKGNLRYENDGKNIFETKPKDTLWNNMGYFVPTGDGKWTFTFFWNMAEKSCFFSKSKVDINEGKIQDVTEVTEIDEVLTNSPDEDSRILVTDGFLRHMWYRAEGMHIYGYDVEID